MRPAAVFDLDGTLLFGTSAERLLVPYLVRRGVVGVRQLSSASALALTAPVLGFTRAVRRNKRYLAGLDADLVREHTRRFVADRLEVRFDRWVIARWEALRDEGRVVCLLTGAPSFVAEAVGERLGAAAAVGTELEVRDGRFTGRLSGPHLYGDAKRASLLELARRLRLDLTASYGFADHGSDTAFLRCFGRPVAVRPKAALRRAAKRSGWEILGLSPGWLASPDFRRAGS